MKRKRKVFRQEVAVLEASPETGLTQAQAAQRAERGWANGLAKSAGKTEWDIVAENLFTFFNLVFVILAVALALAGSSVKNMTFLVVVVCNLCIGCYQEIRAKRAVDRLTLVAAQKIRTIRDGKTEVIPSDLLVRDDIVEFVVGDQICADGTVLTPADGSPVSVSLTLAEPADEGVTTAFYRILRDWEGYMYAEAQPVDENGGSTAEVVTDGSLL